MAVGKPISVHPISIHRAIRLTGLTLGERVTLSLLPHSSCDQALGGSVEILGGLRLEQNNQSDLFDNRAIQAAATSNTADVLAKFQVARSPARPADLSAAFPFSYAEPLRRELFASLRVPLVHAPFDAWLRQLGEDRQAEGPTTVERAISTLFAHCDDLLSDAPAASPRAQDGLSVRHACDIFDDPVCGPLERVWFFTTLLRYAGIATRMASGLRLSGDAAWPEYWVEVLSPSGLWASIDCATGRPADESLLLIRRANSPSMLAQISTGEGKARANEQLTIIVPPSGAPDLPSRWDSINRTGLHIDRALELLGLSIHSSTDGRQLEGSNRLLGGSDWLSATEALCDPSTQPEAQTHCLDRHIITDGTSNAEQTNRTLAIAAQVQVDISRRLGLASLYGGGHSSHSVEGYPAACLTLPQTFRSIDTQLTSLLLGRALLLLNADGRATGIPNQLAATRSDRTGVIDRAPSAVWRDLEALSDDLTGHHIPWDAGWFEPLFSARFPNSGGLTWGEDGELQVRSFDDGQALEFAFLPNLSTENGRLGLRVDGQTVPLHVRGELTIGLVRLPSTRAAGLSVQVIDRWMESPIAQGHFDLYSGILDNQDTVFRPRALSDQPAENLGFLDLQRARQAAPVVH